MKIIASFDDGASLDLKLADLLKKYEIPAVFYIPWDLENLKNLKNVKNISSFLTKPQCLELSKEFEIGSHTVTHNYLTRISIQMAQNEIFDSKKYWEDFLGRPVNKFCYPRGYSNPIVRMLVKNAGYQSARTTIIGHLRESSDPFQETTTLHVGIDRIEYKNISWELFADKMIAEATEDSIFHIFGHSWEIENFKDWENVENLFKKLTGK